MGTVFVAEQLSTGKRRALKVMHPGLVQDPLLRQKFAQEARVGSMIASDHVVEVVGAGSTSRAAHPGSRWSCSKARTSPPRSSGAVRSGGSEVVQIVTSSATLWRGPRSRRRAPRHQARERVSGEDPTTEAPISVKVLDFGSRR